MQSATCGLGKRTYCEGPVHIAIKHGPHLDCIKLLLEAVPPPCRRSLTMEMSCGQSLVQLLVYSLEQYAATSGKHMHV